MSARPWVTGGLGGTQWETADQTWSDAFLSAAAGDASVRVEVRGVRPPGYCSPRHMMQLDAINVVQNAYQ
jgi:hypothetical protein